MKTAYRGGQGAWGRSSLMKLGGMALWVSAILAIQSVSEAAITFQFNFTDAAGTGWNDNTYGLQRRDALMSAANTLGSYFNATATIGYTVTSINNPLTNILASASSSAYGPVTPGFEPTVVEYKLQSVTAGP